MATVCKDKCGSECNVKAKELVTVKQAPQVQEAAAAQLAAVASTQAVARNLVDAFVTQALTVANRALLNAPANLALTRYAAKDAKAEKVLQLADQVEAKLKQLSQEIVKLNQSNLKHFQTHKIYPTFALVNELLKAAAAI